ncbi:MAG: hypothetical protein L3K15_02655 [Thermoplasmata archaeon]|nr:hypothetical protein [Thermoplasmata archaeon]
MTDLVQFALGVAVLGLAIAVAGWTSVLTIRFAKGGEVVQAMIQRSFLPEKQGRYILILSVEGSMFLNTGIVWGLSASGVIPSWLGGALVAVFLAIGMGCVAAITWLGYRPSRLTAGEQVALRNRALYSLFLAPMAAESQEP